MGGSRFPNKPQVVHTLLLFLKFFAGLSTGLCADTLRKKTAMDLVYRFNGIFLRFRPLDYVDPPGTHRIDVLGGKNFGPLNAYLYWILNNRD